MWDSFDHGNGRHLLAFNGGPVLNKLFFVGFDPGVEFLAIPKFGHSDIEDFIVLDEL